MKKKLLFILLLVSIIWLPAVAQSNSGPSSDQIFTVVEQQPEFRGGMAKLDSYLQSNLRHPKVDRKEKRRGRVFISFVITDTGAIEDVKALNSLGPAYDEEAIRLVREMPRWIPGRQSGRPVYVRYNLPIHF